MNMNEVQGLFSDVKMINQECSCSKHVDAVMLYTHVFIHP